MSEQDVMTLRRAEILCRILLEMGNASFDKLPDVMRPASSDLNGFKGAMRRASDCRELAMKYADDCAERI